MKDCGVASSSTTKGTGWLGTVSVLRARKRILSTLESSIYQPLGATGDNNVFIDWC